MHAIAVQLALVLAAEKSKVPFYVAGGVLVLWALTVALGLGLRRGDFPTNLSQQRAVIAVTVVLVLGALSTAVITAGGSRSEAAASTGAQTAAPAPAAGALKLAANPSGQLSYDAKQLSAKAGSVTIAFANSAPLEHNLTIAQGGKVLGATPTFTGGSRSLTLQLKPGKYVFYCSVPGHRQAGMEGTLNVS
jgi:uncharacterized cupredoxin-like copper-binding protein